MLFQLRSNQKELLDDHSINKKELHQNLSELEVINSALGGHRVSVKGLASILKVHHPIRNILDIGCGSGSMIYQFSKYADKINEPMYFYGVDLNQDCVAYAEKNLSSVENKKLLCCDYRDIPTEVFEQADVIHCSLFLHHLDDEEIIDLFRLCREHCCILLVNDLHRHWFAYHSIKMLTGLFSNSHMVKNDAPLSVKRGFTKKELQYFLHEAGFSSYSITWNWAFRYLIVANR